MDTSRVYIKSLIEKHGKSQESLLPILQDIEADQHFVSREVMLIIAEELSISAAHVFGTASFYSFLDLNQKGKNIIRVCKTITCSMKGKEVVLKTIQNHLGISIGETTKDKKFSLLLTNCIGYCHKAPAMIINDTIYTELTPDKIVDIISEYNNN